MIDLDSRSSKLEKERQQRLSKLRQEKQQEQRKQQEYEQRQKELQLQALRLREREELLREQREEELLMWRTRSGGVSLFKEFQEFFVVTSGEEEEQDNDKIVLSEECLNELMEQDCFARFPVMLFRLEATVVDSSATSASSSSVVTKTMVSHAGVKEFSSPKNSIGLPRKVIASLGGDLSAIKSLTVRFILLPKCSYAKLKPRHNRFFEVGPVKRCLEENLRYHATLTVGDVLTVWYRGVSHTMTVVELKPGNEVTVIDTDVELDLDVSEEFQQTQQAPLPAPPTLEDLQPLPLPSSIPANSVGYTLGSSLTSIIAPAVNNNNLTFYRHQEQLQHEADGSQGILLTAKVKLPNGKAFVRKFYHHDQLLQLFLAVSKELGIDDMSASTTQQKLVISTRFPPRSFSILSIDHIFQSFESLDIKSANEQFFVTLT